jgi:hypothetical protein
MLYYTPGLTCKLLAIFLCLLVVAFVPAIGFSQKSFISVGAEIGLPNSTGLDMVSGTLAGGSLRFESSFGKRTAGIVTIGYLVSSKQVPYSYLPTTTSTYKVLPFLLGIKYYTKEKETASKGFFISGELGLLFTSTHFTYASNADYKRNETDLGLAFGIGYLLGKLEPSFRLQQDLSDSGFNVYYYNFRVAYAFTNNK